MKKASTTKNDQFGFSLTLKSANQSEYPIIYSDDQWQIVQSGSKLYALFSSQAGSYTQEEINEKLAEQGNTLPVEIVTSLPTTGVENTLYLLINNTSSSESSSSSSSESSSGSSSSESSSSSSSSESSSSSSSSVSPSEAVSGSTSILTGTIDANGVLTAEGSVNASGDVIATVSPSTSSEETETSIGTLFTKYQWKDGEWHNLGPATIDLTNYISSTEYGTNGHLPVYRGGKKIGDSGIASSDLSALIADYKSTTSGALGKLLDDYQNGNLVGSGLSEEEQNIMNTFKQVVVADANFVTNIKKVLTDSGKNIATCAIQIPTSNYFSFTTTATRYAMAQIVKKGANDVEVTFHVGYIEYTYYSASDTVYFCEYDSDPATVTSHTLV